MSDVLQRLFFALWPGEDLCEALLQRAQPWLNQANGRPVARENLHITLAFLGAVAAPQRACVEQTAAALALAPFDLTLDHLAYWPRPRVAWAGATDTPPSFVQLADQLAQGARACGLQIDRRPPVAHLTLKRKVTRAPAGAAFAALTWPVREFHLVSSVTLPAGPRYERLKSWPLR